MRFRTALLLFLAKWGSPPTILLGWLFFVPYPVERLAHEDSVRVLDRHGRLLDEIAGPDGTRRRWVRIDELPPHVLAAFVAAEDRRFWEHPGVDPRSIVRAIRDNLVGRRSGGSTITMQVVRLVEPRSRTLRSKVCESILALRIERSVSKREILEQYLNRAPFGNRVTGIEAAAQLYFAKPARDLSLAEAAYLAALPHAPTRLNPYRSDRVLARQGRILREVRVSEEERSRAQSAVVRPLPISRPILARHFPRHNGRTTIDLDLQTVVEGIVRTHLRGLVDRQATNAAVVVFENASGDVLALVGAADGSWVNGATARRGPGSTVKPFTYALAFERRWTPQSVVLDAPAHFETPTGDYCPRNYDGLCRGPVTIRMALASSLNIPAVRILHDIGPEALHGRLRAMGWPLDEDPQHYGLGLTLGDGETTLVSLTASYVALANRGEWTAPRWNLDEPHRRIRVFEPKAAEAVLDILSDDEARATGFGRGGLLVLPFQTYAKTGTSPDFRDNWCIGGTARHTVGVWVGNLDGSPMRGVSGISGAAPIWRDLLLQLGAADWSNGRTTEPSVAESAEPFDILSPNDWDLFYIDPSRPRAFQELTLQATTPARWWVDGLPVDGRWRLERGRHDILAEGPDGTRVRRRFRVE